MTAPHFADPPGDPAGLDDAVKQLDRIATGLGDQRDRLDTHGSRVREIWASDSAAPAAMAESGRLTASAGASAAAVQGGAQAVRAYAQAVSQARQQVRGIRQRAGQIEDWARQAVAQAPDRSQQIIEQARAAYRPLVRQHQQVLADLDEHARRAGERLGTLAPQVAQVGTGTRAAAPAGAQRPDLTAAQRQEMLARRQRFVELIKQLGPVAVGKWVTGKNPPPKTVQDEADRQRRAMLAAMHKDLGTKPGPNEDVASPYRSYKQQDAIWTQKYNFTRDPFDKISPAAAAKYGLTAGDKWDKDNPAHRQAWKALSPDEKQQEILQASSGPGTSRHHWGTDIDLFSTEPGDFEGGGGHDAEYQWLTQHAQEYGFEQTYTPASTAGGKVGYFEERWHWSYVPAADPLQQWAADNPGQVQKELSSSWGNEPKYSYLREHYTDYMQNTDRTGPISRVLH
jgi:D-alanyl-D-alanine carboxypeptidase